MNPKEPGYEGFTLIQEMMQSIDIVKNFNPGQTKDIADKITSTGKLLLTGEGSSRIFPAKNTIRKALKWGLNTCIFSEGSRQAAEYDLSDFAVFCASNSGRTREVVLLAKKMAATGNRKLYALTAYQHSVLEKLCNKTFILSCGPEQAVAATKSVIEQALFYESILWHVLDMDKTSECMKLPSLMEECLMLPIDREIVEAASKAPVIYFSGYNDGVAEELTLKTNEITRKKSDYLEGTYAVHGIEEVMNKDDLVVVIDPIEDEIEKFREVLVKGIGITVVAIADRPTPFKTIRVPPAGDMNPYLYLCAGWNLLVETGLALGINLDKPERARKIGNEYNL